MSSPRRSSVEEYGCSIALARTDLAASLVVLTRRLIAAERPILDDHGLTMWGYIVLSQLGTGDAATQHALAAAIGYDKTRLIGVLDELEHGGLVSRSADPTDRRARIVSLTTAGRDRQAAAQRAIHAMEDRMLAHVGADERHTLQDLLTRAISRPRSN
jgi:DNA-binding MarR family transcriptional regulator